MRSRNIKKRGRQPRRTRLRKDDKVVVTTGVDKGKGPVTVLNVMPATAQILVEGINMKTKHLRKSRENPQGGVIKKEFPVDISNVLLYSDKAGKGIRIHMEERDGKKVRVGSCGTVFE